MTAKTVNLRVEKYATFNQTFRWKDQSGNVIDNTGYSALMHVRLTKDAASTSLVLQDDDSSIILGGTDGLVTIVLSSTVTGDIDFDEAFYDLVLTKDGIATRLIEGKFIAVEGVTHD